MDTYLGIDPSLNGTGVCILNAVNSPTLTTIDPKKLRGAARLAHIRDTIKALLEITPVFAAIESYSYNSTGRVFQLGEVGGVLRVLLFDLNIPFVEVAPTSLKKYATGDASADKADVIRCAQKEFGADPADDNQADAFFLAQIAMNINLPIQNIRSRAEVLHQLQHPQHKTRQRAKVRVKHFL